MMIPRFIIYSALFVAMTALAQDNNYTWKNGEVIERTIASEILTPPGFVRVTVDDSSFAEWLRYLPLKKAGTPVFLHNGQRKGNQEAHFAVIDIDPGTRNLQQCADAVMRLRAEYLYSRGDYEVIHFKFTSGDEASFRRWITGYRPIVNGNNVTWEKRAQPDSSYQCFREYLEIVFTYAGSYSLSQELKSRRQPGAIQIGDLFIKGGFPGHAVIVIDMAYDSLLGEKLFLLAQSYMPAQDIHILKNPNDANLSSWYKLPSGPTLVTPEWVFKVDELKCFDSE
ncbi:MAG: DUF4846 domain-containing protein [candidate division Zixibacteria bacterium]|nr:DUF4846 domain-containing protein [candidate division Zixibacteria bacterium]